MTDQPSSPTPLVGLSIAGSDSSAGAGIAADLKTFAAHRIFGTVALTAITAQNTTGVSDVLALRAELVSAQIDAVLADFPVAVAKTGMLATIEIIEMLIGRAEADQLPELVVDPVMVASSGAPLFSGDARASFRHLLQFAAVTTPNLAEAETLLGHPVHSVSQMRDAARELCDLGVGTAVVKGGHMSGLVAIDVICDGGEIYELSAEKINSANTHGTGCTLSAATCANLLLGHSRLESIGRAKAYVSAAIARSADWQLGKGHGPLDHFPPGYAPGLS